MAADAIARPPVRARHPRWPHAKRIATLLFFALVVWLLVAQARSVDWDEVMVSLKAYPIRVLFGAAATAMASYALYCSFDLLSRRYARHTLSTPKVLLTTFISYAFNLNLGSLIGGLGLRYRMYSRLGLGADVISRIFGFTMLTNWLGYMLLAGVACLVQPIALPEDWSMGSGVLSVAGVGCLALVASYLALCAFARKRSWTVRGHEVHLPSGRLALLQLVVSCATWMLIACVIWILIQHHVDYISVLAALLVAAVAGVITHVPGGLGVLEAVFVALLAPEVPKSELLASLLVFRAVHYLIPLAQATLLYAIFELRVKSPRSDQAALAD
jgi:uncharacterized membrane protein YbhN (UPF0104 family)